MATRFYIHETSSPVQPASLQHLTPAWETGGQLCEFCANHVFSAELLGSMPKIWHLEPYGDVYRQCFQRQALKLSSASLDGCPLCSRLIATIHGFVVRYKFAVPRWPTTSESLVAFLRTDAVFIVRLEVSRYMTSQLGQMGFQIHLLNVGSDVVRGDEPTDTARYSLSIQYVFSTTLSCDSGFMFPKLHGDIDTSSEACFAVIKGCIDECDRQHKRDEQNLMLFKTNPGEVKVRPARLIDVASVPSRVMNSSMCHPDEEYLALSYSWGAHQEYTLTESSIRRMTGGLDQEKLPKTVLDAILVARKLGYRYLWIDALCIIQDDTVDKAAEISKMHAIYRDARITIVSALTTGVHDSFLDTKKRFVSWSPYSHALVAPLNVQFGEGHLLLEPPPYYDRDSLPINNRAWVLQEHLMSSHLLIYGIDGIEMCCRTSLRCSSSNELYGNSRLIPAQQPDAHKFWLEILEEYSQRQMKQPSDKLIAVSALARTLAPSIGKYFAGLWEGHLARDLCWRITKRYNMPLKEYRAPSWSWAKCEGIVTRASFIPQVSCTVVDCQVTPAYGNNPYGAVKDGFVTITGIHRKGRLHLDSKTQLLAPLDIELELGFSCAMDHHWPETGPLYIDAIYLGMLLWQLRRHHYPPPGGGTTMNALAVSGLMVWMNSQTVALQHLLSFDL